MTPIPPGQRGSARPRIRIDLAKLLPPWAQYTIAAAVAAGVMALAWHVGRGRPEPTWVTEWFIPAWQWVGLALLVAVVAVKLVNRRRR